MKYYNCKRKNMGKKGDMTMPILIKLIVALFVLVILVMIIWNYTGKSKKGMDIGKDTAIDQVTEGKCEILGMPRKCCEKQESPYTKEKTGTFSDCSNGKCCDPKI